MPEEIKPIQVAPSHTVEIVCETPDETTPATWYKDDVKLAPDDVKYETTTKERKRSLVIKDVKQKMQANTSVKSVHIVQQQLWKLSNQEKKVA